jgi:microcystin-dependent protein
MSFPAPSKQLIISKINTYLQANGNITAAEHNEIELLLVDAIYGGQIGDIKEISCDVNYINTNFDMGGLNPGLGKSTGERYGWAICNGRNGTIDKRGNVSVGYDPSVGIFSTPAPINVQGPQAGTRDVTLSVNQIPAHFHHTPGSSFKSFVAGSNDYRIEYNQSNSSTGVGGDNNASNTEIAITNLNNTYNSPNGAALEKTIGGGQSHNNMQPYVVTLFIQRIPPPGP